MSAEPFSHRTGSLRCLQKEMATYRHWSVSLWRDPDDVPHCRILSPDRIEWCLISATLCGWRRCFVADQLWFMTHIREEVCFYGSWSSRTRQVADNTWLLAYNNIGKLQGVYRADNFMPSFPVEHFTPCACSREWRSLTSSFIRSQVVTDDPQRCFQSADGFYDTMARALIIFPLLLKLLCQCIRYLFSVAIYSYLFISSADLWWCLGAVDEINELWFG